MGSCCIDEEGGLYGTVGHTTSTVPAAWKGASRSLDSVEILSEALTLLEPVGTGTTASVYRGLWDGKVVAIKQIEKMQSPRRAVKYGVKEQVAFAREMAILMRVDHPHLVRFFGASLTELPLRIVTEFCQGGTCFDLLHQAPDISLAWSQRLKMCHDIACGMNYLHTFRPQIIHRDLKSLNLLLTEAVRSDADKPCVKISDFGVARTKEGDDVWGEMTAGAGTPHWMAPEVFKGMTYDEKADVYSFAIVLYEIVSRELPFEDEEPGNIGNLTLQGKRPDLSKAAEDCPETLLTMTKVCWSPQPKERPDFGRIVNQIRQIRDPSYRNRRRSKGSLKD